MTDMLAEVRARHFPRPPASSDAITQLEQRIGCPIPVDLRKFYLEVGAARLFSEDDSPYRFVRPDDVRWVNLDVSSGDPEGLSVPKSWFSICDVQDGNYVAIDLPAKPSGEVWFIDCFHETIGEPGFNTIIALNFSEFLQRALASNGLHYWLDEHPSYGDAFARPAG